MRTITRRPSHTASETRARGGVATNGHRSNHRLRPRLVSDAVIAGYIHDISVRHRPSGWEGNGMGTDSRRCSWAE